MTSAITREQFVSFRTAFRARSNSKDATPADHVLNNIICSAPITRGFSPITNQRKLNNGQLPEAGVKAALTDLKWAVRRFTAKRDTTILGFAVDSEMVDLITGALDEYSGI